MTFSGDVDPIENSVDSLAEMFMEYTDLTVTEAQRVARNVLEFARVTDLDTAERD